MKRNISDLMDHVLDIDIPISVQTPLSSHRIKELTMSRIKKNNKKRMSFRVLLVAAILAALGVTVVAAEQIWGVSGVFLGNFSDNLESDHIETIDNLGASFPGGITSNGATITPISVLGDDNYFHFHIRVEAPDGTVLPDGSNYHFNSMGVNDRVYLDVPKNTYKDVSSEFKLETLPDEDPTDNVKEFMLRWYAIDEHVDLKFNDGVSKILTIPGLWEQTASGEYREIFTGDFSFDIGRYQIVDIAKADVRGLSAWCDYANSQVTLQSMAVSSLGIRYIYTATVPSEGTQYPYVEFEVVLKDGTRFKTMRSAVGIDPETGAYGSSARFAEYVPLEDIDYICFGDNRIELN